jgi:GH15 family glucan-1,4-alpha-glucosidase
MPRFQKDNGVYYAPPEITRLVKWIKGNPSFKVLYDPQLEYAQGETKNYIKDDFIISVVDDQRYDTLTLYTDLDKDSVLNGDEIKLDQDYFFKISYNEKIKPFNIEDVKFEFEKTKVYWLNWCFKTPTFDNAYNEEILRSAITLKLLTFEKTGAVLAAATTSLPETIGEVRNWDYRFCWIRDASMVIKVITKLGHLKIVKKFIDFIIDLIPDKDEKLQIMYGISGEKMLTEKTLDHLSGYQGSKPVRIGNAAFIQKQNDIYGILMDAIHFQIEKYIEETDKHEELWSIVKSIVWVVEHNWKQADKGIWEFRKEDRHFTFSKLLCWVAVDRAIKISDIIQSGKSAKKWEALRTEIYEDILENAWNEEVQAFTQSYGTEHLDASVLLMEPYGFIDAKNPKYIKTVKAIEKELSHEGLLFRYKNDDDFGTPSSSFTVCTFWFINSLYKIGEEEKSKAMFDQLLSYSNHLGLFSEDIDFKSKRLLGNFPQAYSHLALIDTALNFKLQYLVAE